MRRHLALPVSVGLLAASAIVAAPAHADTVLAPCVISVPTSKVVLRGDRAVEVTATITDCPAEVMTYANFVSWAYNNTATNSEAASFTYEGEAIYPLAGMTRKFYSWDGGVLTFAANQEDWFCNTDCSQTYRMALVSTTPTITAKLGTSTAIKVKKSGKKRTITVTGKRWAAYSSAQANAPKAVVYRNGKKFKTVKLKKGKATLAVSKSGKWQARQAETGAHWGSQSKTVKK